MADYNRDLFLGLLLKHRGRILGGLLGLIVSLLILSRGLVETVFILALVFIGYLIGSRWDLNKDFKELLDSILPPHE